MTEIIKNIEVSENIIREGLKYVAEKDYVNARPLVDKAYELFKAQNSLEGISICLSIIAFLNYSEDKNSYEKSMALLNDATFMAMRSDSDTALLINEFCIWQYKFFAR